MPIMNTCMLKCPSADIENKFLLSYFCFSLHTDKYNNNYHINNKIISSFVNYLVANMVDGPEIVVYIHCTLLPLLFNLGTIYIVICYTVCRL